MISTAQELELKKFVETDTYRKVKQAISYAVSLKKPVLVYGEPGLGKTVALLRIAAETGARLMTITQRSKGTRGMYEGIVRSFGYAPSGQYLHHLIDEAQRVAKLNDFLLDYTPEYLKSRLLMVDEYQTLEPTALRELLEFCMNMQLPLLLCGNAESLAYRAKESRQAIEQLRQRIFMRIEVGKPSARDCRDIGISFNVEGVDTYAALTNFGRNTSLRELVDLLQKANVILGGSGSIKLPTLETALHTYGGEKSLHLLSNSAANVAELDEITGNRKRIVKTA
jgi:DNA transposition AAA+ family ATPase